MTPFDPFEGASLNTAAAFYACWECPDLCNPPPPPVEPWEPIIWG